MCVLWDCGIWYFLPPLSFWYLSVQIFIAKYVELNASHLILSVYVPNDVDCQQRTYIYMLSLF